MDFATAQHIFDSALPLVAPIPGVRRFCLVLGGLAKIGLGNYERGIEHLLTCRA